MPSYDPDFPSVRFTSRKDGSSKTFDVKYFRRSGKVYFGFSEEIGGNMVETDDILLGDPQEVLDVITEIARFLVAHGAELRK